LIGFHSSRVILLFTCTLIFSSAHVLGGDDRHTLTLEWQRSKETLSGEKGSTQIAPIIVNIHYAYQFEDAWSMAVSAWDGEDEKSWDGTLFLSNQLRGLSAAFSFQQNSWWLDAGAQTSTTDTRLYVKGANQSYSEKNDILDLFVNYNFDLDWRGWWITPGVGIGYQQSRAEIQSQEIPIRMRDSVWRVNASQRQDQNGSYLSGRLTLAYPMPASESVLYLPALSLDWIEPLWGKVYSRTLQEGMNSTATRRQSSTQSENASADGSGFLGVGVTILLDQYSAGLTVTEPIADDQLGTQIGFQLGMNF